MPIIYLREPFEAEELQSLKEEFFQYRMLARENLDSLAPVEILYGDQLSEEELSHAHHLRWIHSTTADTDAFCLPAIKKRGILLTITKGQNMQQMAEFVVGGVLAFAKRLFEWPLEPTDPSEFWHSPLKEEMWTTTERTLLQVGLGEVGSAIVKMANSLGFKTWGVRERSSFHPFCQKTFEMHEMSSVLPAVDIVSVAMPKTTGVKPFFTAEEFSLMKEDSILTVVGSGSCIDEKGLYEVAKGGKFRGILLDAYQHPPPQKNSPLREIPNIILTPGAASCPESAEHTSYRLFRKNLRLFAAGRISEMKNLITLS